MCKNKCEIPFAFRVCFNFKFDCAKFEISYPPKAVARAVIAGGGDVNVYIFVLFPTNFFSNQVDF